MSSIEPVWYYSRNFQELEYRLFLRLNRQPRGALAHGEWKLVEPLLPQKRKTNKIKWSKRTIFDAMPYQLKNGCNWRDLPKDFPPYQTVYHYYSQWRKDGTFDKLGKFCHQKTRELAGKDPNYLSLIMVDSQAVKNTCTADKRILFLQSNEWDKKALGRG